LEWLIGETFAQSSQLSFLAIQQLWPYQIGHHVSPVFVPESVFGLTITVSCYYSARRRRRRRQKQIHHSTFMKRREHGRLKTTTPGND